MPAKRGDLRKRLFGLAAEQAGYFTAAQAKSAGYSYQAQSHHVNAGNWVRIDRGLFRLAEWIPDIHDDLARWYLWSKQRAVVSHETALSVHGISEFESAQVHLTVPPGFTMSEDGVALHYAELPESDVDERLGYRVTTAVRSIIDIAAHAPDEDQLARAIADAQQAGQLTVRTLRGRAEAVDTRAALYVERALQRIATS